MQATMTSYVGMDKTCPLYLGVCHGNYKLFSQHAGVRLSRFSTSDFKGASSICTATSISPKGNPDFPKQSKIYSRSGGRESQQRETFGGIEEGDPLHSKNGTSPSLSKNSRYNATASPGQREKEIVELFRKVQAQLRGRTPPKPGKKVEAPLPVQGDRGTVDSLLQLLRKHSVDQGKNRGSDDNNVNYSERTDSFEEEPNSSLSDTESFTSPGVRDPVATRPVSNFQRKSPVPRVKYQPVYSAEDNDASDSLPESTRMGKKKTVTTEPDVEPLFFDEAEDEFDDEPSSPSDLDEVEDEIIEQVSTESSDLNSLKITELRELAKSRGLKGYSRLKKVELVKLLGGGGGI